MSTIRENPDTDMSEARRIAPGCPVGCLVVSEMGKNNVFYKNVHTGETIKTNFTERQVEMAHNLPSTDPSYLEWDYGNSMIQKQFQVYKVNGK